MNPNQYFKELDLWDLEKLKQHAHYNLVNLNESKRFPGLVLLSYSDECQFDKKWSPFSLMARGLLVDIPNQEVLIDPLRKFFNMNENSETSYENLSTLGSFETSEKVDGSWCGLFQNPNDSKYHITTRGSLDSEQGQYATSIIPKSVQTKEFTEDWTLMFELISARYRIVIDYSKKPGYEEGLYLIGARNKRSGKLLSYKELGLFAKDLGLPCVKTYSFESLDHLITISHALPIYDEGFVLRWAPELLVKIKGPAYLRAHRFISQLSDKHLLEAVSEGISKELIEICPEEYRDDVVDKINYFQKGVAELEKECYTLFGQAPKRRPKKGFCFLGSEKCSFSSEGLSISIIGWKAS